MAPRTPAPSAPDATDVAGSREERSRPRRLAVDRWGTLTLPLLGFLAVVFVLPVGAVVLRSFRDPVPGLQNYREIVTSPLYLDVLANTFLIAFSVTALALAIGYPYAYLMTLVSRSWRAVLLVAVLLPFWTSLLIRSFAWVLLLRDTGAVNAALLGLGLIDQPLQLMRNLTGVVIGMVQVMLPFAVLPLYATMRGIDRRLLEAAEGLGARPSLAFWRIFVPLTVPGVTAGALLVFVQSLGFYITPALLGGPEDVMLSQLIVEQVTTVLQWGFASALAVVLLVATVALLAVSSRFVDLRRYLGGSA